MQFYLNWATPIRYKQSHCCNISNQFSPHFRTWRAKIHCDMGLDVRLASADVHVHVVGVGHVEPVTIT
jgi:hypothetical protein